LIAAGGYRVLIHDRRNTGASDVVIDGESEYAVWADDLHILLGQVGATPAFVGGSSSGCRLSLTLALRHPQDVRGLLLWRVTGGEFASKRLAHEYYGQYVEIAKNGGMAAVCETQYFQERIAENPSNRDRLMKMDVEQFIEVESRWRDGFLSSMDLPVIGASVEALRALAIPACVVPGNDNTHGRTTGENLAALLPNSEVHILMPDHEDVAVADWNGKDSEIAAIFVDFMNRKREL
jgi:pimeloyl-ACP methyl ester carboxylesterase